ncbi:MAG: SigB/SigF/SigG family RNA polymerase sigma factor [Bacilli bacterium]
MARNKVVITGINTSEIKVLSSDEMNKLFIRYQSGDVYAKELLVNGNLKLVLSILRRFMGKSDNLDDLFQIGCIGLIKAIDNFDLAHEVKFSTYAVPMILGEIKRYVRDNNSVRISRSIKESAYKILSYKDEFILENGREPSSSEIARHFSITEYDVSLALLSLNEPMSIFDPIYNDGGDTIYLLDQLEDKKERYNKDELMSMKKALLKIKERERRVLIERYIVGKTQSEIASDIDISQAQVSRIEKTAINNVRRLIK